MTESLSVLRDLAQLLCHNKIGRGMSREVYTTPLIPGAVVKVEDTARCFQNVIEWETWQTLMHTKAGQWLAPCLHISPCGSVLVMARTTPTDKLPKKIPAFLTDTKRTNYGLYQGRVVCHDYGTHLAIQGGADVKNLHHADWWDE